MRLGILALIAAGAFAQDSGPVLRVKTRPRCTEKAIRENVQGIVRVQVSITERGDVSAATVNQGIGFGLDREAIRSVKQWKFTPALKQGRPVRSAAIVQVNCECVR
jgi:protein TonB